MDVYTSAKIISMGISCFILYLKLIDTTLTKKKRLVVGFILICLYFILNTVLSFKMIEPYKSGIIIFALSLILWKCLRLAYDDTFVFLMISFAVSLIIYMFCAAISSFVSSFLANEKIVFITTALQLAFSLTIYKMNFEISISNKKSFKGVCFFITGILLGFYSLVRINTYNDRKYLIVPSLCFMIYGLYSILKRETILSFQDKAQRQKINQMALELNELIKSLDFLAERDHKINKYLKAVYNAVWIYTHESTDAETKSKVHKILNDLTELRKSLQIETQEYLESVNYKLSGLILVDSILLYMLEMAKQKGIELDIDFKGNPGNVLNFITQEQLCTLVSELIDNAITAVEHNEIVIKKIHFMICTDSDITQIVTIDNGLNFSKDVLNSIGKRRITTHKNTGGSGIGLWNIFKIVRSAKASLIINEFDRSLDDYTKSVIIRFDGKCKYTYTNRKGQER